MFQCPPPPTATRQRRGFHPALSFALLIGLSLPAMAGGLVVNLADDRHDADPADGRCDVDNGLPGDQCSLRAAAEQARSRSTHERRIRIAPSMAGKAIRIERGPIPIAAGTELTGNPKHLVRIDVANTHGEDALTADGPGIVTISGFDIRLSARSGAAIAGTQADTTITLSDLRIRTAQLETPALRLIDGRVDCLRCRFVDGVSTAVKVDGGELRLVDSLVSDNRGADGGGLHITGGRVWLQRSEVSRNRSEADGGGIRQSGGELWMVNSLLRGNLAARGGGGLAISGGVAELQNSSVIGNVANADAGGEQIGGGLLSEGKAKVRLRNSIVSANRVLAMTFGNECAGSEIFADAANFIGPDPGCQPRSADNDLVLRSAAAMTTTMRPLPWGGLRVMAMPSPGHPAIDAGVSGCLADIDLDADTPDQPLLIDLRQLPRPAVNGARRCDLGAIQTRCDTTCTDTVVQSAPSDAAVTTSELRLQTRTDSPHASTAADTPETSRP